MKKVLRKAVVIAALIAAVGGIIVALINNWQFWFKQDNHPEPTIVATATGQTILTVTPTPTATPQPRSSGNLITSSHVVAIFIPGQSSNVVTVGPSHSTLQFTFNNTENGTGLALVFDQPLNVTPYHSVEISGTSTKEFSFVI